VRALSALVPSRRRISVLDHVNPFSVGLGLAPPHGDYSVNGYGHSFNAKSFIPAERTLRDVQIVMEPTKRPLDALTPITFYVLYQEYLEMNFDLSQETEFWKIYTRRVNALPLISRTP
jgi:hypothetical protein